MSTYRKEGKDVIIFATPEDHKEPSNVKLPEPEPQAGLILPNGEINWNCPCLGGMATGPCGLEFREAFSCFHNSEADPKGSDCYEAFKEMHLCMAEYPQLYDKYNDDDENENDKNFNSDGTEKALGGRTQKDVPSEKEKSSVPKVEDKAKSGVPKDSKKSSNASGGSAPASGPINVNA